MMMIRSEATVFICNQTERSLSLLGSGHIFSLLNLQREKSVSMRQFAFFKQGRVWFDQEKWNRLEMLKASMEAPLAIDDEYTC